MKIVNATQPTEHDQKIIAQGGTTIDTNSGNVLDFPEQPKKHNDARLLGEETEELKAFYNKPCVHLAGELWGTHHKRNTQDKGWKTMTMPWGAWINGGSAEANAPAWGLSRHPEDKNKAGTSIVLGSSIGGARKANAMVEMFALGLDIDSGAKLDDVITKIEDMGLFALIYTSHSHGKIGMEIKRDELLRKLQISRDPTLLEVQEFLRTHSKSRYEESFIEKIKIEDPQHQTTEGVKIVLSTPPLDKFRIIFPLEEPVKLIDLAPTQSEALDIWADKITGMAWEALGIHFDTSCTDPSRLFYGPRHAKGAEWDSIIVRGDPLKFENVPTYKKHLYAKHRDKLNPFELVGAEDEANEVPSCLTPEGKSLNDWHRHAKDRFQLATLIEDTMPDKIRHSGSEAQGHVHVECPFEAYHTSEGGTACMAVDALDSTSEYWTWFCHHDSCQDKHKLEFLAEALEQGWIEEEVLFDEDGIYLLEAGEEVYATPQSNVDHGILNDVFGKIDEESKTHEILAAMARFIEVGIDETDKERATGLLVQNTVLKQSAVNGLWKKAYETQSDKDSRKEAQKQQIQISNKVMPELVPMANATAQTVNAAAENSKWLPKGTVFHEGWFGERKDKSFYKTCCAFEVVYAAYGESGSDRVSEITIRYPHRSGRLGIVESTYSLGETFKDSGAILGRIVDAGLETHPHAKAENLMTLLRAASGREAVLVEKSGWNEDRTAFVAPTGEVINSVEQTFVLPKKMRVSDKKSGSLELWVENVSTALRGRNAKYFLPGLLTGAVGCLSDFLDTEMSVILANEGASNRGKSTSLKGGVSWWTIGAAEGLLSKGDVTSTAVEMLAAKATGAVLALDEEGASVMAPEDRQALFLKMAEGQGRARGKSDGGVRDVTKWRTCFGVSTEMGFVRSMEKAMAQNSSLQLKTGAVSRIVSINYDNAVILTQAGDAAELAAYGVLAGGKKGLGTEVRAYGWAGPVLARELLELGVDAVSSRVSEIEKKWGENHSGAEMRVVGTMALFCIAAQVAKEAGLFPEDIETDEMLREHLTETLAQRSHHLDTKQQATDKLRAGIIKAVNEGTIIDADDGDKLRGRQTLGYYQYPDQKSRKLAGDAGLDARIYIIPVDRLAQLGANMDVDALVSLIIGDGDGHWDSNADKPKAVGNWGGIVPPGGKKYGKRGLHESVPTEGKALNIRLTGEWVHNPIDPIRLVEQPAVSVK